MIWELAGRARHCCAKESVLLNSLRCNRLLCFSVQHDIDRARVRAKDTNLQIIANAVRTQHAERISMITGNKAAHLITRHTGYVESFHGLFKFVGRLCQMPTAPAYRRNALQFPRPNNASFQ
jgi:hypothetical protein